MQTPLWLPMQIMGQASAERLLPPHNLNAHTAWEAYPWSTLVPGDAGPSIRPGRMLKAAQEAEAEKEMRERGKVREKGGYARCGCALIYFTRNCNLTVRTPCGVAVCSH